MSKNYILMKLGIIIIYYILEQYVFPDLIRNPKHFYHYKVGFLLTTVNPRLRGDDIWLYTRMGI